MARPERSSEITATVNIPGTVIPPQYLRPIFDRMPPELTSQRNWLLWAPVWNGLKWTKRPIQPSGFGASTTNPKHWSSFEDVKKAYGRAETCGYMEVREKGKPAQRVPVGGVGYVFDGRPDDDGLVVAGIDFDDVVSGDDIDTIAQKRIEIIGSYTERSVSGAGVHVIAKAKPLRSGIAHNGVEIYTSGRFFTMTGTTTEYFRIIVASEAVDKLVTELQFHSGHPDLRHSETRPAKFDLSKFTTADRDRLQKLFGHLPADGLADGLEADLDEVRSAVSAIPPSAIAEEPDWVRLARALAHQAARFKHHGEQLWEILETVSKQAAGYNQEENRRRFERYIAEAFDHDTPITIDTVFHLALQHGWQGLASAATIPASITSTLPKQRSVPIANLPPVPRKREWLHGTDLMRGAVSMLVAPGAKAKTTLLLTCALACASGRPLLGAHVYGGKLGVLYLSTEDSLNEIALRLRAAMHHNKLNDGDVPGLHIIAADQWRLPLLRAAGATPVLNQPGWDALIAELDHVKPDILVIDPLINIMGGVNANDNSAAALLMGQFVSLAAVRHIAVMIAHHAAKGRDPSSAESAMGAASFVNLCRIALGIEPLAEKEAGALGLPPWEANSVFRLIGTKQNFSPPGNRDRWFRISACEIPNQQPPVYIAGDKVAVVEVFQPGTSGPVFAEDLIRDALAAVSSANPPLSPSKNSRERYASPVISRAIARYRSGQISEIEGKAVLDHLIRSGLIKVEDVKVPRSGGRADQRKGLILTPSGKAAAQWPNQNLLAFPQSPQTPAGTLQDDAGGDPSGPPQHQGGVWGGMRARELNEPRPHSKTSLAAHLLRKNGFGLKR